MRLQPINEVNTIHVLLAIEDAKVSDPLVAAFETDETIHVVGVRRSGRETVRDAAELRPDVLLISSELPDVDVLSLLRQLRRRREICSVLLVRDVGAEDLTEAVGLGAAGALDRTVSAAIVAKCIRAVADGEYWFRRDMTRALVDSIPATAQGRSAVGAAANGLLTRRETDVMGAVARGKTNREIGLELDMSEHTVKQHLKQVFGKLGVSSRVELALRVARPGQ